MYKLAHTVAHQRRLQQFKQKYMHAKVNRLILSNMPKYIEGVVSHVVCTHVVSNLLLYATIYLNKYIKPSCLQLYKATFVLLTLSEVSFLICKYKRGEDKAQQSVNIILSPKNLISCQNNQQLWPLPFYNNIFIHNQGNNKLRF